MGGKAKRNRTKGPNSGNETTVPRTPKKAFIGLVVMAVSVAAGLYWAFGPGGQVPGADPANLELVALGEGVYRDNTKGH